MNTFVCRPATSARKAKNEKPARPSGRNLESASSGKESVVVALNAGREMTKHALDWALTNVVQAGDQMTIICLLHAGKLGSRRLWGLPKLAGDCANRPSKSQKPRTSKEMEEEARESCSQSLQHLHKLCDAKQVNVRVKVVDRASKGVVAMEAQSFSATWVVLDSQLNKEEAKFCLEKLQCNLVVVKKGDAKILQLGLRASSESGRDGLERTASAISFSECASNASKDHDEGDGHKSTSNNGSSLHGHIAYTASEEGASSSSPEVKTPFTATEKGTSSVSSSEHGASPFSSTEVVKIGFGNQTVKICADQNKGDGAPGIDYSDVGSDYGLVDALSDDNSSNDESCGDVTASRMLCLGSGASSDVQSHESIIRCPKSPNVRPSHLCRTQGDGFPIDPWMASTKARPSSAVATPKIVSSHCEGRITTPTSPSSSKRLTGNSRLSFSMREGGSAIHQLNSSLNFPKTKAVSQQRRSKHPLNSTKMCINAVQSSDLEKVPCLKKVLTAQDLIDKFSKWYPDGPEAGDDIMHKNGELERTSSVRKAVSLSKHTPPGPPPLCSICQHKAPVFGKPPRRFMYAELELATGGFSQANFLAEGGFGSVHRGVLPDGQAVAVKQHKLASSQGDLEFCSEVEVLSCAQHRNVVMLIGYCIEDKKRLLVYEFICNGSLDTHLYSNYQLCNMIAFRHCHSKSIGSKYV